jgi:dTDP-4-dehydrorhamnose reductase
MKTLITGASGRLGKELVKLFPCALHPTKQELDITNSTNVKEYFKKHNPNIIIHSAAMTSVEECERNHDKAFDINVKGTENLVSHKSVLATFVYISTACVFQGEVGRSYTEDDKPFPKNYYGLTKYLGEMQVENNGFNTLIIRTNFIEKAPFPYQSAFCDRWGTYL